MKFFRIAKEVPTLLDMHFSFRIKIPAINGIARWDSGRVSVTVVDSDDESKFENAKIRLGLKVGKKIITKHLTSRPSVPTTGSYGAAGGTVSLHPRQSNYIKLLKVRVMQEVDLLIRRQHSPLFYLTHWIVMLIWSKGCGYNSGWKHCKRLWSPERRSITAWQRIFFDAITTAPY